MSLVQRVTSIEGTDRVEPPQLDSLFAHGYQPGYGTIPSHGLRHQPSVQRSLRHVPSYQRSLRHVISYDALADPEEPTQATNPAGGVTQYTISTARRVAQVCFTVLCCWLASGLLFGFAALKPVLIDQGVYREYCTLEELEEGVELCYKQDLRFVNSLPIFGEMSEADFCCRLNLFFAVASTTYNISTLPVGTILDRYGPRTAAIMGSICLAIGTILMAFAFYIPEFDGYIVGNIFLALGGTFIFVPSFAIANAFPKYSGTIVATVTGAFDASAAVLLFYRLAYEGTGGSFTPDKFFTLYLLVPVAILIGQLTLMNEDAYKTVPQLEFKIEKEQDATRDVSRNRLPHSEPALLISARFTTPTMTCPTERSSVCAPNAANTVRANWNNSTSSSATAKNASTASRSSKTARPPAAYGAPCTARPPPSRCSPRGSSSLRSSPSSKCCA